MKKIGIVSSIGPASTIDFYRGINHNFKKIHVVDVNHGIVVDSINIYRSNKILLKYEVYNQKIKIFSFQ